MLKRLTFLFFSIVMPRFKDQKRTSIVALMVGDADEGGRIASGDIAVVERGWKLFGIARFLEGRFDVGGKSTWEPRAWKGKP